MQNKADWGSEFLFSMKRFWKLQRHGGGGESGKEKDAILPSISTFLSFQNTGLVLEEVMWGQHGSVEVTAH